MYMPRQLNQLLHDVMYIRYNCYLLHQRIKNKLLFLLCLLRLLYGALASLGQKAVKPGLCPASLGE